MNERFQGVFVDVIAMLLIVSATIEAILKLVGFTTWVVQLFVGIVLFISPLSQLNSALLEWFKGKFK